jgi:hypothetical protein
MISDTGKPLLAYSMAGASARDSGMVPYRPSSVAHPSTTPGTDTDSSPRCGTVFRPRRANSSGVAAAGARPLALRPYSFRSFAL